MRHLKKLIRNLLPQAVKDLGIPRKISGKWIFLPLEISRYFPAKHEKDKFEFISQNAFGTALDLGAHVGLFTVELSRKCEKVVAFEPTEDTFRILTRTLNLNNCSNVEIRADAVSNICGEIEFYITDDVASCLNSTAPIGTPKKVKSITLDSLNYNFDYIKMDIEGSEFKALSGAIKTLNHVKFMSLEIHPRLLLMQGDSPDNVFDLLAHYSPTYFLGGKVVAEELLRQKQEIYEVNVIFSNVRNS
jgi:FkbM family methyltransferase